MTVLGASSGSSSTVIAPADVFSTAVYDDAGSMVTGGGDDHRLMDWPWLMAATGVDAPDSEAAAPVSAIMVACGTAVAGTAAAVVGAGSAGSGAVGLGMKPHPAATSAARLDTRQTANILRAVMLCDSVVSRVG